MTNCLQKDCAWKVWIVHRKIRHADPRWKTDKYEVLFQQKGLFQADISIHHALCAAALQNYHASVYKLHDGSPPAVSGGAGAELDDSVSEAHPGESEPPGNEWGFGRMSERITAAQQLPADGSEADTEAPVVRLPNLQVSSALSTVLPLYACRSKTTDPSLTCCPTVDIQQHESVPLESENPLQ